MLLSADFRQLELRIIAHLSGDQVPSTSRIKSFFIFPEVASERAGFWRPAVQTKGLGGDDLTSASSNSA